MEGERPAAYVPAEDDPSVSKVLDDQRGRVEDAAVPTPIAMPNPNEAPLDEADSSIEVYAVEGDRNAREALEEEMREASVSGSAGRPAEPEEGQLEPEEEHSTSKAAHPPRPVHRRHGSKHGHSRNPSDVCPRVAVIATQEEEENVCSICLDEFCDDDPIAETQCGHGYHLQCIMQWAQRSQECPLCFSQLSLADEEMNALLPFGEYSSPQEEQAMSNMLANMEFETFLVHLAAAERRQARQQRRESQQRASEDGGHVVITATGSPQGSSAVGSPTESVLKSVRRGFASFFLGK
jgi:hypothetical protein